jgi:hypothetical protein
MFQNYFSVMCYRRRKKNAGMRLSDAKIQSLKVEFASKRTSGMTRTASKESASVPAPVKLRRKKRGHRAEVVYKFMVTTIEVVAK